jgi:hypothetical protein
MTETLCALSELGHHLLFFPGAARLRCAQRLPLAIIFPRLWRSRIKRFHNSLHFQVESAICHLGKRLPHGPIPAPLPRRRPEGRATAPVNLTHNRTQRSEFSLTVGLTRKSFPRKTTHGKYLRARQPAHGRLRFQPQCLPSKQCPGAFRLH